MVALQTLCRNVEEDFYLMCPDGHGELLLHGFISCFPGGFDGPSRIGMSFKDIHDPVPHYQERIAKCVDRFVARMKAGDNWQRFNVSTSPFLSFCSQAIATVQTLPTLYSGVSRSMEKTYSVWTETISIQKKVTLCRMRQSRSILTSDGYAMSVKRSRFSQKPRLWSLV